MYGTGQGVGRENRMKPRGGIPRYLAFDGPALFRQGFRPFFLGAGLWALIAIPLWLAVVAGAASLPTAFDPIAWHAHEMIFGFAAAVIAGFLMTAIPNWTGRLPLQGRPLMLLFGIWLAGRIAISTSEFIGPAPAAALDLSFLAVLLAVVLREILCGRNWRNLPMPIALTCLLLANLLTHLEAGGQAASAAVGQRLGIATVILLISLVGGRIIPSFTGNWLAKRGEPRRPPGFGRIDQVSLFFTALALGAWVAGPEVPATGAALLVAGLACFVRLSRWRGHRTLSEPLLWSLHLGFAWVAAGLCLLGLGTFSPAAFPAAAGLHALTAGAIGSMTLAVMARATLSHSGRRLIADWRTTAMHLLIAAAALGRVAASLILDLYVPLLWAGGLLWCAAFGFFAVVYGRILVSPPPKRR